MTCPPVRMAISCSMALRRSPKPGALTASTFSMPRSLFKHEGGQGFAVNIFGDDDQVALADLDEFFEHGDDILGGGDLLVVDQDVGFGDDGFHVLGIGDEVGRDVAAVELHTFDVFVLELQALGFFNGDDAVFADFVHHIGDQVADLGIRGGVGGDRGDLFFGLDLLGHLAQSIDDRVDALLDAALEEHRVGAGGQGLQAFGHDGVGQNGGGGGAVTGDVIGLGGGFLEKLRAHIFKGVFEFDFLGDGHAVMGDGGGAELAVEGHVAALGAEGGGDGVGDDINAFLASAGGLLRKKRVV